MIRTTPTSLLDVAIVGAGICGMATALALRRTGHNVTIFEARESVTEIGAGIQLAPNATKQLKRWGLGDHLDCVSVFPQDLITKRWKDGTPIGRFRTAQLAKRTGSPFIQLHRGDLHDGLRRLAEANGVCMHSGSRVTACDHNGATLMLESGSTFSADLIVAADGIRSRTRREMEGGEAEGDAKYIAYRASIHTTALRKEPDLRHLVEISHQLCWAGPSQHCVTYAMQANSLYNTVFIVPFRRSRKNNNPRKELLEHFADWDPQLLRLISLVDEASILTWPLWLAKHSQSWHKGGGKVTLLGDAAHDMTPFLGQGACMAIEDAACLEQLLLAIRSDDTLQKSADIASALEILQAFRAPRVGQIRRQAEEVLQVRHLVDGAEQQSRDALAAVELTKNDPEATPYIFTDPVGQDWLYSYDIVRALMGFE